MYLHALASMINYTFEQRPKTHKHSCLRIDDTRRAQEVIVHLSGGGLHPTFTRRLSELTEETLHSTIESKVDNNSFKGGIPV